MYLPCHSKPVYDSLSVEHKRYLAFFTKYLCQFCVHTMGVVAIVAWLPVGFGL